MPLNLPQKIKAALREDLEAGDVTSRLLIPSGALGRAVIVAKEPGIFCGARVVLEIFKAADRKIKVRFAVSDGRAFKKGAALVQLQGPVRGILAGERTALNLLGHLCGIATRTRQFADRIRKMRVKILDTRKTTPLWRDLEKYAVKCGGGENHRMGLYDAIFVKENHRKHGDLRKLVNFRRQVHNEKTYLSPKVKRLFANVEIEVRNVREMMEALMLQPKVILFDNFKPAHLREAVKIARRCNPKIILEASGGITLDNIAAYARTGVDQISIGSLTHSVKAIDLSLLVR
jgi:nicotinate-nucleotide pyrophosphorylase (carboxylating)